ncbi:MAG: AmmeMemoRadiSam system protein A [Anaerolineae bacterium]
MTETYLTDEEGTFLLRLARRTIEEALAEESTETLPSSPTQRLEEPGATFVTLHTRSGALRGCIGSLAARRPLVEDVRSNALAAAFEDPRFPPLKRSELSDVVVEISVLTPAKPLEYQDPQELLEKLRPGVDGVVIERGWHRATFLPQVWEQLPRPEKFLAHLCYKAGLSARAWQEGDLSVSIYEVQKFEEDV